MNERPPKPETADKPLPLQFELPPAARPSSPMPPPRLRSSLSEPREDRPGLLRALSIAVAILFALGAAAYLLLIPWYVRRACIEEAASHGIDLSVENVVWRPTGFRLVRVRASAAAMPDASASAPEVEVQTRGLRPQSLSAPGAELQLAGSWSALATAFALWRSNPQGGNEGFWGPSAVTLDGAHLTWLRPVENARIDASEMRLELVWRTQGGITAHASSDHVMLEAAGIPFRPWRVDLDRAAGTSRVRVALDPGVPDSSTLLVLGNDDELTSIDLLVPRSPLAHLGVPSSVLGWIGSTVQVEASARFAFQAAHHAELTVKAGLHGLNVPPVREPLSVVLQANGSGDPRTGIDLQRSEVAMGPLVGALKGTLRTFEDGLRFDCAWRAVRAGCQALGFPGGTAGGSGSLAFDTRDLGDASLSFAPDFHCMLAAGLR